MEGRRTHTAGSSLGGAVALRRLLFDEKMLASLVMSSQKICLFRPNTTHARKKWSIAYSLDRGLLKSRPRLVDLYRGSLGLFNCHFGRGSVIAARMAVEDFGAAAKGTLRSA
jgi:hypothetical protein